MFVKIGILKDCDGMTFVYLFNCIEFCFMIFDIESKNIYDELYRNSIQNIQEGKNDIDFNLVDKKNDKRRGITLLIRPDKETENQIIKFQKELFEIDENQYYQPEPDLHITILSVISCYDGFELEKIDIVKYSDIIQNSLVDDNDFSINFKGVTTSTNAIMIQGFCTNSRLSEIRQNLRNDFKKSNLQNSVDSRYFIKTSHITSVRFITKLKNPKSYSQIINRYREFKFGSFKPKEFEFVYNDWYQSNQIVKVLKSFSLK